MSQSVCQPLTPASDAAASLQAQFIQRIVPLEQEYLSLLESLYATLLVWRREAKLPTDQHDELSAWIDELERRITTYQTLCAKYRNALTSAQHLELMTYMLFGDARSERAQKNVEEYVRTRDVAIGEVNALLAELRTPDALAHYLRQRLHGEARTRHFLDESRRYRARSYAG